MKAAAQLASSTTSTSTQQWWKKQSELWVDVHTEEQFYREINSGDRLVFVDFFATWCNGCQRSYPELCKIAMDPDMQKQVKFVKVCIEELKKVSRDEGVKALPYAQVYKPGQGKLVGLDIPPSKVKHVKHNLQIILHNPKHSFKTDPNGFVIPVKQTAEDAAAADAAAKAAEVAALNNNHGSLFDHLLKNVLGEQPAAASEQQQPPAAAASSLVEQMKQLHQKQEEHTKDLDRPWNHGHDQNGNGKQLLQQQQQPACTASLLPVDAQAEKQAFLERYSKEYGYGGLLDQLYPCEVGCRMKPNEHYMDYTGSSVYCQSQIDQVFDELRSQMFGNPHSANPSSSMTGDKVEEVRDLVLKFFNADPAEYQVVFTRSATGALKLVGETFPWSRASTFAYLRENHNSVLGMREYALEAGGSFKAVNETFVEHWAQDEECSGNLLQLEGPDGNVRNCEGEDEVVHNLFAFPAEDNFAGVKYPLRWIRQIKAKSTDKAVWRVLVDAAAYVPTQPLDLREVNPDFVALSFYKMFGYPTGLGALIVRVDAAEDLRKLFWGGGAVSLATSSADFHVLKCRPADKLEDGTVNFLDIISLKHGFGMIDKLGGIRAIQSHVAAMTEYLYNRLSNLRHSNGKPMLQIFGKHHFQNSKEVQGGIINFEVLRPDGTVFSYKTFEREAAEAGFHVRTGAECNPGACYNYLGVTEKEIESLAGKKEGCHDDVEFITVQRNKTLPAGHNAPPAALASAQMLQSLSTSSVDLGHPAEVASQWVEVPLGSVRASLGYMSTWEDCYALVQFIESNYKDRS